MFQRTLPHDWSPVQHQRPGVTFNIPELESWELTTTSICTTTAKSKTRCLNLNNAPIHPKHISASVSRQNYIYPTLHSPSSASRPLPMLPKDSIISQLQFHLYVIGFKTRMRKEGVSNCVFSFES
jgi:hypothetical protein